MKGGILRGLCDELSPTESSEEAASSGNAGGDFVSESVESSSDDGRVLTGGSMVPSRVEIVDRQGEGVKVMVAQPLVGEDGYRYAFHVWPAARAMSHWLWDMREEIKSLCQEGPVVELGAGCGLVSLVAAHALGRPVLATDVGEEALNNLRCSVEESGLRGSVVVEELCWGTFTPLVQGLMKKGGCGCVLAADVLFDSALAADVFACIYSLLMLNDCPCFVCVPIRSGAWSITHHVHAWKLKCTELELADHATSHGQELRLYMLRLDGSVP